MLFFLCGNDDMNSLEQSSQNHTKANTETYAKAYLQQKTKICSPAGTSI